MGTLTSAATVSSSSEFHRSTILSEKKYFLKSSLYLNFFSFSKCLKSASEISVSIQATLLHWNRGDCSLQGDRPCSGHCSSMCSGPIGLKCHVRHCWSCNCDGCLGEVLCMPRHSKALVPFLSDWRDSDPSRWVSIFANQADVRHSMHWKHQGLHPNVPPFVCWRHTDACQGHSSVTWSMLSWTWRLNTSIRSAQFLLSSSDPTFKSHESCQYITLISIPVLFSFVFSQCWSYSSRSLSFW